MKTRNGFVSNSSSSSFAVFGIIAPEPEDLEKLLFGESVADIKKEPLPGCEHDFDRKKCKFCPECGNPAWLEPEEDEDCDYGEDYYELEDDLKKKYDLDIVNGCDMDVFIGRDLEENTNLKDLQQVEKTIKQLFKKQAEFFCDVIEG